MKLVYTKPYGRGIALQYTGSIAEASQVTSSETRPSS